jgi:YesN/AraC family two-component response regulator
MDRRRVIIADDRHQARDGLKALLAISTEIAVVAEAANGWEAVQLVEEYRPDVVLMDVQMPVMDGVKATRIVKQRWPECRVIVLTAYTTFRSSALEAGADVFLIKGCPSGELLDAILEKKEPGGKR